MIAVWVSYVESLHYARPNVSSGGRGGLRLGMANMLFAAFRLVRCMAYLPCLSALSSLLSQFRLGPLLHGLKHELLAAMVLSIVQEVKNL